MERALEIAVRVLEPARLVMLTSSDAVSLGDCRVEFQRPIGCSRSVVFACVEGKVQEALDDGEQSPDAS